MDRAAMEVMRNSVDHNALTDLHKVWGGSHDFMLGFMIWLSNIPTYSFERLFFPIAHRCIKLFYN